MLGDKIASAVLSQTKFLQSPLTEYCEGLLKEIPATCITGPDDSYINKKHGSFDQRCQKPIEAAAECLANASLECKRDAKFWSSNLQRYFVLYYIVAGEIGEEPKTLPAKKVDILTAFRDVYFAAINRCDHEMIQSIARFVQGTIKNDTFGELIDYIEKTKIAELTERPGVGFGNRFATLLLVKFFIKTYPAKTPAECLEMAFKYFPASAAQE